MTRNNRSANHSGFGRRVQILLLSCVLAAMFIIYGIVLYTYGKQTLEQIRTTSVQQVDFLNGYLSSAIDTLSENLLKLSENSMINSFVSSNQTDGFDTSAICAELRNCCRKQTYLTNAYAFNMSSGQMISAYEELSEIPTAKEIVAMQWYTNASKTLSYYVGRYMDTPSSVVVCVKMIRNPKSMLLEGFYMLKFSNLLFRSVMTLANYPYGQIMIIDDCGHVYCSSDGSPQLPVSIDLLPNSNAFVKRENWNVYTRKVPNSNLYIISVFSDYVVLETASLQMFLSALLLGLMCVALMLAVASRLLRNMIRPVKRLASVMGSYPSTSFRLIEPSGRDDEIGLLEHKYNEMIAHIDEMIDREYRATIALQEAQYKALQMQINPHFINNTLQTIGSIAVEQDQMEIYDLLRAFSQMFYYCLKFKGDIVTLDDEIAYLSSYMRIQEARFPGKFTFRLLIDEATRGLSIPKMTVQPLVENCFSHSFGGMRSGWEITVRSVCVRDGYDVTVEDNGSGIDSETMRVLRERFDARGAERVAFQNASIGMQNVNGRIVMLYGAEYGLSIETNPGNGTKVRLHLPLDERSARHVQVVDR